MPNGSAKGDIQFFTLHRNIYLTLKIVEHSRVIKLEGKKCSITLLVCFYLSCISQISAIVTIFSFWYYSSSNASESHHPSSVAAVLGHCCVFAHFMILHIQNNPKNWDYQLKETSKSDEHTFVTVYFKSVDWPLEITMLITGCDLPPCCFSCSHIWLHVHFSTLLKRPWAPPEQEKKESWLTSQSCVYSETYFVFVL